MQVRPSGSLKVLYVPGPASRANHRPIHYKLATANWARPEMDDLAVLTRVTKVY